ncbi:lanC-like protein 3 isoform X2 [Oratosquilla oratoria]
MMFRLSQLPQFEQEKSYFINEAIGFLKRALEYTSRTRRNSDRAAFMLGSAGVIALAAVINKSVGQIEASEEFVKEYAALVTMLKPLHWLPCGGDELLVGRAGYLCGVLWLRKELNNKVLAEKEVDAVLDVMVQSGVEYARQHKSPFPLMYAYYRTEYLGAAHGLAGILQMMLSFPSWLSKRPEAQQLIRGSVDALLGLQTPEGNFPCAMDELDGRRPEEEELVHWCHGAPGTVYLLIKAHKVFGDEKYLKAALRCGEITWHKGLLKKGPGICHGVAGSAYVFLALYRATGDKQHLHRAHQFFLFIFMSEFGYARTPDVPYSLYEGLSGTACLAADLFCPDKAAFPFFEVF